ncbi:Cof-type HAD-IIB family hydrolase [Propionispora vibrioides]|jgi:Cof subfamily protein (haloacid dehalogenase superfamily)|nr:Cof-type HAD-IIB family hydrolase [Propionispora vibrioides]
MQHVIAKNEENEEWLMEKKIVFFDVDGTMLHLPGGMYEPLPSTCEAVRLLQEKGHYAVVASARGKLPAVLEKLNFDGFIGCNGNYITFHQEVLYDNYFKPENLDFLLGLFREYDAPFNFTGSLGIWSSPADHPVLQRHRELFGADLSGDEPWLFSWQPEEIHSGMVTAMFAAEQQMLTCRDCLPKDWLVDMYTTENIRMDIHLPGHTKGKGVRFLHEKLGIDFANTFAFGDARNDLEMMRQVNYGIAMGNATEELKAAAFAVTDDVDKDGIYKALKKYGVI